MLSANILPSSSSILLPLSESPVLETTYSIKSQVLSPSSVSLAATLQYSSIAPTTFYSITALLSKTMILTDMSITPSDTLIAYTSHSSGNLPNTLHFTTYEPPITSAVIMPSKTLSFNTMDTDQLQSSINIVPAANTASPSTVPIWTSSYDNVSVSAAAASTTSYVTKTTTTSSLCLLLHIQQLLTFKPQLPSFIPLFHDTF